MTMTGLPLAVVFFLFFFLFLIHFQQPIHIGLCRQKFPHFLTGTPVLGRRFSSFPPAVWHTQIAGPLTLGSFFTPISSKAFFAA